MSESYIKFGALLRQERERRGQKLEVISSDLKIPIETLQHLEAGQRDALPSELYFRLFLKSYAEYLGIDFTKTLEAIREELGELVEPATLEPGTEPGRKPKAEAPARIVEPIPERASGHKGLWITLALVIVIGLAVAAYFLFFTDKEQRPAEVPAQPAQQDYGTTRADFDWDTTTTPRDSMLLTLTARIGSWATVLADGDTMVYQMLTPGRPYNVTAREQLLVTIGNPLVVDVTLNGQPATLADPETGQVSQVEIDSNSLDMFIIRPDTADTAGSQPVNPNNAASPARPAGGR